MMEQTTQQVFTLFFAVLYGVMLTSGGGFRLFPWGQSIEGSRPATRRIWISVVLLTLVPVVGFLWLYNRASVIPQSDLGLGLAALSGLSVFAPYRVYHAVSALLQRTRWALYGDAEWQDITRRRQMSRVPWGHLVAATVYCLPAGTLGIVAARTAQLPSNVTVNVGEIATPVVAILAATITAIVAVGNIRKAADQQRLTALHNRMTECMIETYLLVRDAYLLINAVAQKAVYSDRVSRDITGTAFERFQAEFPGISQRFNAMMATHELLLPSAVFLEMKQMLDRLNASGEMAFLKQPDERGVYPDTQELVQNLDTFFESYNNTREEFRRYMGSNELTAFAGRPASPVTQEEQHLQDAI